MTAIPGTKTLDRFRKNLGALAVNLDAAESEELAALVPGDAAAGARYPQESMKRAYP